MRPDFFYRTDYVVDYVMNLFTLLLETRNSFPRLPLASVILEQNLSWSDFSYFLIFLIY